MARHRFAGDADSLFVDSTGRPLPGAVATVWSAKTGGSRITDLLAEDGTTPIADGQLIGSGSGILATFYGPEGVSELWVDSGRGRLLLQATDLATRVTAAEARLLPTGGTAGQVLVLQEDGSWAPAAIGAGPATSVGVFRNFATADDAIAAYDRGEFVVDQLISIGA